MTEPTSEPTDLTDAIAPVDTAAPRRTRRLQRLGALESIGVIALLVTVLLAAAWVVFTRLTDDGDDGEISDEAAHRWVMTDRFDVEPSALLPVFEIDVADGVTTWRGSDGCRAVDVGLTLIGETVDTVTGVPTEPCDIDEATPFVPEAGDRIETDDDRITVFRDDAPVAIFQPVDALPTATEDDLVGVWVLQDLRTMTFERGPFGDDVLRRFEFFDGFCRGDRPPTWRYDDEVLSIDGFTDRTVDDCAAEVADSPFPERFGFAVRRVLVDPTAVLVDGDALVLVDDGGAVALDPPPEGNPTIDGVNVSSGTAFGVAPGVGVSPDDVLTAIEPVLGAPTYDSGWVDLVPSQLTPCPETNDEYRELWWGDLRFAFWQRGSRTSLHYWVLGPVVEEIVFGVPPELDRPSAPEPSGLVDEGGRGLGGRVDQLEGPNVLRVDGQGGGAELVIVSTADGGGVYRLVDGVITSMTSVGENC